jgi:hypothetical protein
VRNGCAWCACMRKGSCRQASTTTREHQLECMHAQGEVQEAQDSNQASSPSTPPSLEVHTGPCPPAKQLGTGPCLGAAPCLLLLLVLEQRQVLQPSPLPHPWVGLLGPAIAALGAAPALSWVVQLLVLAACCLLLLP